MKTPVRVFISGPFREMMYERQILADQVIPKLRDECEGSNVSLVWVDLRWGISQQQFRSIDQLDSILGAEISRASLFIALLGKAFGWVPPSQYDSETALEIYRALARLHYTSSHSRGTHL